MRKGTAKAVPQWLSELVQIRGELVLVSHPIHERPQFPRT
jgi:hypothetical protein